jgi:hypothetical protein
MFSKDFITAKERLNFNELSAEEEEALLEPIRNEDNKPTIPFKFCNE